jgi:hypothetical protein
MATISPRIGQRGTQNSNALESVNSNLGTSNRVVCPDYYGPINKDINFYTVNTSPDSNNPRGFVNQIRIDNSGNIGYFGIPITQVYRNLNDTSCNICYYNKIIEITAASTIPSSATGIFRIEVYFKDWPNKFIGTVSKILCSGSSTIGPGFGCTGYVATRNGFPGPDYVYFYGDSIGLTVVNGTVDIGPKYQPFSLQYEFTPTNKPDLMTCFISQAQSVDDQQIIGVKAYYV